MPEKGRNGERVTKLKLLQNKLLFIASHLANNGTGTQAKWRIRHLVTRHFPAQIVAVTPALSDDHFIENSILLGRYFKSTNVSECKCIM